MDQYNRRGGRNLSAPATPAGLSRSLPQRAAVVTNSLVALGVTTVMRWLGIQIQAFSPGDRSRAFAYLSLTTEEQAWVAITERNLAARLSAKPTQLRGNA